MIVRDFDFVGIAILPPEANSILIVDPNAVLACAIATEPLKSVSGWNSQVLKTLNPIKLSQLPASNGPKVDRTGTTGPASVLAVEQVFGGFIGEGAYHGIYYSGCRDSKPA